jgi:hypothetical protein
MKKIIFNDLKFYFKENNNKEPIPNKELILKLKKKFLENFFQLDVISCEESHSFINDNNSFKILFYLY